jgi:hypothetical protein
MAWMPASLAKYGQKFMSWTAGMSPTGRALAYGGAALAGAGILGAGAGLIGPGSTVSGAFGGVSGGIGGAIRGGAVGATVMGGLGAYRGMSLPMGRSRILPALLGAMKGGAWGAGIGGGLGAVSGGWRRRSMSANRPVNRIRGLY